MHLFFARLFCQLAVYHRMWTYPKQAVLSVRLKQSEISNNNSNDTVTMMIPLVNLKHFERGWQRRSLTLGGLVMKRICKLPLLRSKPLAVTIYIRQRNIVTITSLLSLLSSAHFRCCFLSARSPFPPLCSLLLQWIFLH